MATEQDEPLDSALAQARAESKLYEQLIGVFVLVAILAIIDVATGGGWWFHWPALGLGIVTLAQAGKATSRRRVADDSWEQRRAEEIRARRNTPAPSSNVPASMRGLIKSGEASVANLREQAELIIKPEIRAKAEHICERASQILLALAEPGRDIHLAHEFVYQVLDPATTVFTSYVRLSERQIAGAQPALDRVETHDLPIIERTLEDLNQRLHFSDIVSLEVASEMLDLGRVSAEAIELPTRGAP